jgi:predicted nucleotidyltransferase component of viral defense system
MITSRDVYEVAKTSGFRPDVVEKVLRLRDILSRLDRHPVTSGAWLLKGGTALNLLHLEVPRLSVDIDLNYIGAVDVDEMREARPEFERALESVCEREGLTVKRVPTEHAGGKFRLRFASVLGGPQSLEVDVSYVARVPLLGTERRTTLFPPGDPIEVTTLPLMELAAGKFTALAQRSVARDAFDAAVLLNMQPGLLGDPEFRLAFVCSIAGGRSDPRDLRPSDRAPDPLALVRQLVPMLRLEADGSASDTSELLDWIGNEQKPAVKRLLDWSTAEQCFLDRLHDEGVVDAEVLNPDPVIQERIRLQPMLQWKALNVRDFREKNTPDTLDSE